MVSELHFIKMPSSEKVYILVLFVVRLPLHLISLYQGKYLKFISKFNQIPENGFISSSYAGSLECCF